jgi:hypothetical protein
MGSCLALLFHLSAPDKQEQQKREVNIRLAHIYYQLKFWDDEAPKA